MQALRLSMAPAVNKALRIRDALLAGGGQRRVERERPLPGFPLRGQRRQHTATCPAIGLEAYLGSDVSSSSNRDSVPSTVVP